MNTRNWSIRSKITALLLVPLLALVVLWGFATSLTAPPALDLLNFRTTSENVGRPAEILMTELQRERRLSLVYLGGSGGLPALDAQRVRTDEAAASFRRTAGDRDTQKAASELARRRIGELFNALNLLPSGRAFIDRRELDRPGALGLYTGIIDVAFRMYPPLTDVSDPNLARESWTLTALARARELLAREDALVSGAIVAGRFGEDEATQVVQLIGMQRYLYADAIAELPGTDRARYQLLTEDQPFVRLRQLEERLLDEARAGEAVPVDAGQWQSAYEAVTGKVRDFEVAQGRAVAERAQPVAVGIVVRLVLAGILGLAAVAAAVLISVRIGRSFVVRLTGLRRAALDMAGQRLPDIVARLRRGETIDVAAEAPPLEYGADEIGQLGRAFTEVQLTAVRSAVDEADLRKGLSDVFLNIARRSQTLLHRQLALLDRMERRSTEPEELEDLFRVDHLATRMRRHAEDLVILAGAAPGRGWRNPVPVIDVIRGAVSEVENYARVHVLAVEEASVHGRAVGDVTHLLAELIENATSFSPPQTRVQVSGQAVPHGYAVEIEDRGLGMAPEALEEANDRLATPPDFDPANSARLGLFVVAQLAARHGVGVRLRPSPYGGITAVALVPAELIVAGEPTVPHRLSGAHRPRPALTAGPVEPAGVEPIPLNRRMRTVPRLGAGPQAALAPSAAREPAVVPEVVPEVVAEPPARPAPGGPAPSREPAPLSEDGLPRRIRQASLAPQLRERSTPPPDAAPASPLDRSPDEIRARMSALQSGTRRGRIDGDGAAAAAGDSRAAAAAAAAAGDSGAAAAGDSGAAAAGDSGVAAANGGGPNGAGEPGPRAVPFRLAAPTGMPAVPLDLPFTGPLGPIGTKEEWFEPSRKAGPPAAPPVPKTDAEEDA
jgi:signal transduction histidine kinase